LGPKETDMSLAYKIKDAAARAIKELYTIEFRADDITLSETKPEFEGDYTIVLFTLVKQLRKSPELLGKEIGEQLLRTQPGLLTAYNVIKGFLNLSIADTCFINFLRENSTKAIIGGMAPTGKKVMVEYSSPNTNKPIHLGHLRNNFLGWSVAQI
jgi:arginyl-tRNA synthetase